MRVAVDHDRSIKPLEHPEVLQVGIKTIALQPCFGVDFNNQMVKFRTDTRRYIERIEREKEAEE